MYELNPYSRASEGKPVKTTAPGIAFAVLTSMYCWCALLSSLSSSDLHVGQVCHAFHARWRQGEGGAEREFGKRKGESCREYPCATPRARAHVQTRLHSHACTHSHVERILRIDRGRLHALVPCEQLSPSNPCGTNQERANTSEWRAHARMTHNRARADAREATCFLVRSCAAHMHV